MISLVKRYSVWLLATATACIILILVVPSFKEMMALILYAIIAEMVALALSELACYIYTKIDFIDKIEDGKERDVPQVVGSIFIGVHILVGLIVLATYQSTILESLTQVVDAVK